VRRVYLDDVHVFLASLEVADEVLEVALHLGAQVEHLGLSLSPELLFFLVDFFHRRLFVGVVFRVISFGVLFFFFACFADGVDVLHEDLVHLVLDPRELLEVVFGRAGQFCDFAEVQA